MKKKIERSSGDDPCHDIPSLLANLLPYGLYTVDT